MQISVNKPSTVYIRFIGANPKKFLLFLKTTTADKENNLYYFRYLGNVPRIKFNIPDKGEYYSPSDFEIVKMVPIETPETYPVLPPSERNRLKPVTYRVEPSLSGGTPARIFTDSGVIEVSPDFFKIPITVRIFLLLHEHAHFFYVTEHYCDMMAMVNFLRMGYNQSTAYYALTDYLKSSPLNIDRMKFLFSQIQKTQKQKL
jgi:hypothetical protein